MDKEIDIDDAKYIALVSNSVLMTVNAVKIEDNDHFKHGYVDHFGGSYEVTNNTRSHTEAILTGAPMQTGIDKLDRENLDRPTHQMLSIRQIARVHDLDGDVLFPNISEMIRLSADMTSYIKKTANKVAYDLNYQHTEDKEDYDKISNLSTVLFKVAEAARHCLDSNVPKEQMANAFNINLSVLKGTDRQSGISLAGAKDGLSNASGSDGIFRFS